MSVLVIISIEANGVDHRSSLIWIYTVCQMALIDIFADKESRRLVLIGFLRVNECELSVYNATLFIKYAQVCTAQTNY